MKNSEPANNELKHVKKHHLQMIAHKANCDPSYVWMILNGKRKKDSRLAKAIYAAAKILNDSIEAGQNKASKKFDLIDQD